MEFTTLSDMFQALATVFGIIFAIVLIIWMFMRGAISDEIEGNGWSDYAADLARKTRIFLGFVVAPALFTFLGLVVTMIITGYTVG